MASIVEIPGYGRVQFPDEMSQEEITDAIKNKILKQNAPAQKELGPFGRMGREFMHTIQSGYESAKAGIESTLEPDLEKKADIFKKLQEQQEERERKEPSSLDFDKISKAYEQGIIPAAKEVLYQTPGAIGAGAASMIGAPVGAAIGSVVPGVGTAFGAAAGMGATSFITQYGQNLQRQYEEQIKKGQKFDPEELKAAGWAAASAALDVGAFEIPFGKLFGKIGTEAAEKLAKESVAKSLAKGAVVGPLTEVPTEIVQQMMERYQAGMDLTSDDAIKEYNETAAQVLMGFFPMGAAGRYIERGRAKSFLAEQKRKEEEAAGLIPGQKREIADRQAEFKQADAERRKQEELEGREAAAASQPMLALPAPPEDNVPKRDVLGRIRQDTRFTTEQDTEALLRSSKTPFETTTAEQRGNQFVVVGESGVPIQGGFKTLEDAQKASDLFNQRIEEKNKAQKEEESQADLGKYVELANKIRNAGSIPIFPDTGIKSLIFNRRMNRQGQPNVLDLDVPFTTPAEIQALDLNQDRPLTIVENKKNGRVEVKSGGLKPGELNLSDRLLQGQEPGIDVASGLTVPQREEVSTPEAEKEPNITSAAEKYLDQAQDKKDPTKFTPKNTEKVTNQLKALANKNGIDLQKTVTKDGVEKKVDKTPQDIVDELVAKRNRQVQMAGVAGEAPSEQYGPAPRQPRTAMQIGAEKAQRSNQIKSALKSAFDKLGLTNQGVTPDVVRYITDESGKEQRGAQAVEAEYNPHTKTITFASDIYDPNLSIDQIVGKMMDVLNHEVVHSLKEAGLFKAGEWKVLENYVKNGEGRKFFERAKLVYPDLNESGQIEEAVADASRAFNAGKFKPVGKPRNLFQRIVNFFKGLFSAAKNNNTSPDEIFNAIRTGEIGGRQGTPQAGRRTMQSRVGEKNWINVPRLLQFLGSQMYKNNIGHVAAKELIQNAFDSVKMAQAQGVLLGPGKIVYEPNITKNTMKITDNGIGMDEEVLRKAFFTVFGSDKKGLDPKDRSGGFGLAKLAYLLAAEDVKIETTKDGVTYNIHTSGEAIKKMYEDGTDIQIDKKSTPKKPNGTSVEVKIPKESIDRMSGKTVKNTVSYPQVLHGHNRKFIGNAKFYEKDEWQREPEEITALTDLSDFDPPETKKFDWGEVDVYTGKKLEVYGKQAQVMSAGVYQFDKPMMDMKYESPRIRSIFNVKPYNTPAPIDLEQYIGEGKKEGVSTAYPFTPDRENFSEFVKKDIGKLEKVVWKKHNDMVMQSQVKAMSSFYKMRQTEGDKSSGFRFRSITNPTKSGNKITQFQKVDVGLSDMDIKSKNFSGDKSKFPSSEPYFHNNLNIDIVDQAVQEFGIDPNKAREFLYELGKVVHDFSFKNMADVAKINDAYKAYLPGAEDRIVGVSLDKEYAGVNSRLPLSGMFLNPFYTEFFDSRKINIKPSLIGAYWLRVMKHEAAHEVARGHDNSFCGEEVVLDTLLHATDGTSGSSMSDLMKRFEKLYTSYNSEYKAMKYVYDRPDTKNNSNSLGEDKLGPSEGVEENSGRETARSGNEYRPRREGQAVPSRRQEGSEGGFFVPKGMSVEAEGVTDQGSVRQKNGPVKQARVGPPGVIRAELSTPQEQVQSNEINERLTINSEYLSKLTEQEGLKQVKGMRGWFKEFIDPYHALGEGADKYRIASALLSGNMYKNINMARDYAKTIGDAKADKKNIYNYLTTRDESPDIIKDQKAREAAVKIKDIINKIGDEAVKRNLISPEQREKFRDQYLPRVLLAYSDRRKHVGAGKKPGFGYWRKSRVDLTEEERIKLGEIEDPGFLVFESLFAPMRDMAVLSFFDKLNEVGGGQWVVGMNSKPVKGLDMNIQQVKIYADRLENAIKNGEISEDRIAESSAEVLRLKAAVEKEEDRIGMSVDKDKFIQMPKDKDRYGPLAGLWVAKPIYRDIMGVGAFVPNNMSEFAALFADGGAVSKASSWFKLAKVAANPPTVFTNIISNALMMPFADVPYHRILPLVASTFKEIMIDKKGKYFDIAQNYGLRSTTLSEAELKNLYSNLEERKTGGSDLNKITNMFYALKDTLESGGKKASNFYGDIETVFKAAIIKHGVESQGLTEEQAVLKANKYLFDYSEVHDSIKVLRNIPFGAPFLTWTYKMTPLLVETALTKFHKFIPYFALYYGIAQLATMAIMGAGGSEDDNDKLRKYMAKKTAENPFVLVTGPDSAFDFGKYMPFTNMYKFIAEMANGKPVDAFKEIGFFGGPVAELGIALTTGKDPFTNMDIVPKGGSFADSVVSWTNFIANVFMPPFMKDLPKLGAGYALDDPTMVAKSQSAVADTLKHIFGGTSGKQAGLPVKTEWEIALNYIGANIYHPSMQQFARNLNTMTQEMNDIRTAFRRNMQDPDLSQSDRNKIVSKYNQLIIDKQKEIMNYVKDSNLSPSIVKIMTDSIQGTRSHQKE
jgi:Histidine kinase-, DNA gyrase B-, and HSP90-like ATPase